MESNITIGLALLAGLASFLSPCVLSLVPAYIGYLGGRTAGAGQLGKQTRCITLSHGMAFVVGFSQSSMVPSWVRSFEESAGISR